MLITSINTHKHTHTQIQIHIQHKARLHRTGTKRLANLIPTSLNTQAHTHTNTHTHRYRYIYTTKHDYITQVLRGWLKCYPPL